MKSDCSDIRFTYLNETDNSEIKIPYWIESGCNSANTKIWVKVPYIPANGNARIYMYYGNQNAVSKSNVSAVFIRVIDGLVLSLHFDEGSGNIAYDSSGNNNHGNLYDGNITNDDGNTPPQWVDGKFGKALSFDGIDDYVRGSTTSIGTSNQMTIVLWTIPYDQIAGRYVYHKDIIRSQCYGGGFWGISTNSDFNNNRRIGIQATWVSGSNYWWYPNNAVLNKYQWNFITSVLDRDTREVKLYINGVLVDSINLPVGPKPTTTGFSIASDCAGPYKGIIDEVGIYNKSLTTEEISDLYNNYGYSTPNYPGKVLVKKYTSPEPLISLGNEEKFLQSLSIYIANLGRNLGKKFMIKLKYEDENLVVKSIELNQTLKTGESEKIVLTDLPSGIIKRIEIYSIDVCPNLLITIKSVNIEIK